jgi:hypothetical protein
MYSKRTGLVLGFHGCDQSVRDKVVASKSGKLRPSSNNYDWLGNGIYFWENNCKRALDFVKFLKNNEPQTFPTKPVIAIQLYSGFRSERTESCK